MTIKILIIMSIIRKIMNNYTNYDSNNRNDNINIIIIISIVTMTHMKQSACLILIKYRQIDWYILAVFYI
jgi:hypothetical protein